MVIIGDTRGVKLFSRYLFLRLKLPGHNRIVVKSVVSLTAHIVPSV